MKILKFLLSSSFMGSLFVTFAVAMALATFIEKEFGSRVAFMTVYDTLWFELIFVLLAFNLAGQMVFFKMFRKEKLPVSLFHLSFILIIAGAGITRYAGREGSMHIREGESASIVYSEGNFLTCSVKNSSGEVVYNKDFEASFEPGSEESFRKKIKTGDKSYTLKLEKVFTNAVESVTEDPSGEPIISLLVTKDMTSRDIIILRQGEFISVRGINVGFGTDEECDILISADSGVFKATSVHEMGQTDMMTRESTGVKPGTRIMLKPMQVISLGEVKVVVQKMSSAAKIVLVDTDPAEQSTGRNAYVFHLLSESDTSGVTLWHDESEPFTSASLRADGYEFILTYGSKPSQLPFSLHLNDFVIERYPGSSSPSGYRSEVTLSDKERGVEKPYSIFMNNILKYRKYRFYQSSYDQDESGTILSVSHDPAGMAVTYSGYGLLFLFIILSLISRKSQFRTITAAAWSSKLRKALTAAIFLSVLPGLTPLEAQKFVPGSSASAELGKVLVQDQKGRTEPLSTLSSDILRKVAGEKKIDSYTPMQVFLGLYFDFDSWKDVPVIRISNRELRGELGIKGDKAAFSDLVNLQSGSYRLSSEVNAAYGKSPGERSRLAREVIKIDERVNIVYMIYRGDFMKVFPLKDGTTAWGQARDAMKYAVNREDSAYLKEIVPFLADALRADNINAARQISGSVSGYQQRFAGYELPSESKIKAEELYYKLGIFEKLFPFYIVTGFLMLAGLIVIIITGQKENSLIIKIPGWLLLAGFLVHTLGIALRWYISGHSPMSNGYEVMLFISWVTILAGFIFRRRSAFALSATAVLAGMALMVAHLSFMDPEITNLVPVLKSYWLTLHVSVITGSYGFLGLGSLLAVISMILLIFLNGRNRERIAGTIDVLLVINFRALTIGLYMLTIGTFLGAVWANESWGRYWGWDPKETWSLITIIVYVFVIHSRMIPGMKNIFAFNLLSLFAFSSVLMTYFGVNYYLSGLHSYASGDQVRLSAFTVIIIVVNLFAGLCVGAFVKYRRYSHN